MHNSSIISLLKSFTPKEIMEFKDFLSSPYFNKKKSLIRLYEIIRDHYPDFIGESVSKRNIYTKLFPGKAYNDNNLRVHIHSLKELATAFVAYRTFEDNKAEFDFRKLVGLIDKNQYGGLDKSISKQHEYLNSTGLLSEELNYCKFRLENESIFFLSKSHFGIFEKVLDKIDFVKAHGYLSSYYYIKSTRLFINMLNLQLIYNKKFNTESFERMIATIDKNIFVVSPVLEIYYSIVKLFDPEASEEYYFRSKEILRRISPGLHFDDINEIYINLTNYCNRKILSGDVKFKREKFELYKEEIELKSHHVKGYLNSVFYKNLVILALDLKEFAWIKKFMNEYKDKLPESSRNNTYFYCMALYEFNMKQFEKSLEFLSKIKFNEIYLKYDSKVLQLMIYYELKAWESLVSSMEAYRQFLSNNKLLTETRRSPYVNFHKFLVKLVSFDKKADKTEIETQLRRIGGNILVSNKPWLIQKMNHLLK